MKLESYLVTDLELVLYLIY